MRLSLEIPTVMLSDITPLTDMNFCLSHLVLQDAEYREFYCARRATETIMDNGFHENNLTPMSPEELVDAVDFVRPTYVIAPDYLNDSKSTYEGYKRLLKYLHPQKIAVVLQGSSYPERRDLFSAIVRADGCGCICLPYRSPRFETFVNLITDFGSIPGRWPGNGRVHLLGMNTTEELQRFRDTWAMLGWTPNWLSMDTAKPIKWGLRGELIELLGDRIHGGGLLDHKVDAGWRDAAARIYRNIAFIRKFM